MNLSYTTFLFLCCCTPRKSSQCDANHKKAMCLVCFFFLPTYLFCEKVKKRNLELRSYTLWISNTFCLFSISEWCNQRKLHFCSCWVQVWKGVFHHCYIATLADLEMTPGCLCRVQWTCCHHIVPFLDVFARCHWCGNVQIGGFGRGDIACLHSGLQLHAGAWGRHCVWCYTNLGIEL